MEPVHFDPLEIAEILQLAGPCQPPPRQSAPAIQLSTTDVNELRRSKPCNFGLDGDKFPSWRPNQLDVIITHALSKTRFMVLNAPVGWGKSVVNVATGLMHGRTLILTSTKQLQNQYYSDFPVALVRGRSNFECSGCGGFELSDVELLQPSNDNVSPERYNCESAQVLRLCDRTRNQTCNYIRHLHAARNYQTVVANYAVWASMTDTSRLGKFDLLIMDEAHQAVKWACKSAGVSVDIYAAMELLPRHAPPSSDDFLMWWQWANKIHPLLLEIMETNSSRARSLQTESNYWQQRLNWSRMLMRSVEKMVAVGEAEIQNWVGEFQQKNYGKSQHWYAEPLSPAPYAEQYIFRGVPRVLMTSGTIHEMTPTTLGVPRGDLTISYQKSTFDKRRMPFVYAPIPIEGADGRADLRIDMNMSDYEFMLTLAWVCRLVESRYDRRGIIHCISYERGKLISKYLQQHCDWLTVHTHDDARGLRVAVPEFVNGPRSAVLVSPSVGTGYNFSGAACEYQILFKIPNPDTRSKIQKARYALNKELKTYDTATEIKQQDGRGKRYANDQCETIMIDGHWGWFARKAAVYLSDILPPVYWDLEKGIPEAPPLLADEISSYEEAA